MRYRIMETAMWENLLSVALGGAIGLLGPVLAPSLAERRDAKKARAIVRAHLIGVLDITEARQHVPNGIAVIAAWRAGQDLKFEYFGSDVDKNDQTISQLMDQVAHLNKHDAAELAKFIGIWRAVRINMERSEDGWLNQQPLDVRIRFVEWPLEQWARANAIARGLIARL
jgi:hypothetical protein